MFSGELTTMLPSTQVYFFSASTARTSGGIGGSQAARAKVAEEAITILARNLDVFIYLILVELIIAINKR
jgi:hypothetical protein